MGKRIISTTVEYEEKDPCLTQEELSELCCEEKPYGLTCCEVRNVIPWGGYSAAELLEKYHPNLDSKGRDSKGRQVGIELRPRKHPCGEKVVEYDLSGGNCCDEIIELVWDTDFNPDVLNSGSSVLLHVLDGSGSTLWKTTNNETHFVNGSQKITSNDNFARLYATEDFCGLTQVTVDDGCTELEEFIRSDLGTWVVQTISYPDPDFPGRITTIPPWFYGTALAYYAWDGSNRYDCYSVVVGRYKAREGQVVATRTQSQPDEPAQHTAIYDAPEDSGSCVPFTCNTSVPKAVESACGCIAPPYVDITSFLPAKLATYTGQTSSNCENWIERAKGGVYSYKHSSYTGYCEPGYSNMHHFIAYLVASRGGDYFWKWEC